MQKRAFAFLLVVLLAAHACERLRTPPIPTPSLLPAVTASPAPSPTPPATDALPVEHGSIARDVTYCTMDGVPLSADLYFAQPSGKPAPLLIFMHGGGWTGGTRDGGMGFDVIPMLAASGYTLASIDYRLAPAYKMPAMIRDAKCAVRSFRAHAAEYGIDPDRIAVVGASAGAHLAAMVGVADESAGFDVGEYLGYSSRVQAVVDMAGPSDLTLPFAPGYEEMAARIFGTTDPQNPLFAASSPVSWVSTDDPPFLIIHGNQDQTVPLEQSQELYNKLISAGVNARLIVVKKAGHGFDFPGQSPTQLELAASILSFLQESLK